MIPLFFSPFVLKESFRGQVAYVSYGSYILDPINCVRALKATQTHSQWPCFIISSSTNQQTSVSRDRIWLLVSKYGSACSASHCSDGSLLNQLGYSFSFIKQQLTLTQCQCPSGHPQDRRNHHHHMMWNNSSSCINDDNIYYTHTHPHLTALCPVSRYQKGKTNLDFTEARDSEWQWRQLHRMQVCTSLQTDNHASTPPLSFYRPDALPVTQPTASKHWRH